MKNAVLSVGTTLAVGIVGCLALAFVWFAVLHPFLIAVIVVVALVSMFTWGFRSNWDWATDHGWHPVARLLFALLGIVWSPVALITLTARSGGSRRRDGGR